MSIIVVTQPARKVSKYTAPRFLPTIQPIVGRPPFTNTASRRRSLHMEDGGGDMPIEIWWVMEVDERTLKVLEELIEKVKKVRLAS